MKHDISVPFIEQKPTRYSCDCGTIVYKVKMYGSAKQFTGNKTFDLYNNASLTLVPNESKQLFFNTTICTSIPGVAILYGDPLLYIQGISYKINVIQTNDSYLNIHIFNKTSMNLTFKENSLHFYCTIVVP
jgi:hypothetical protein